MGVDLVEIFTTLHGPCQGAASQLQQDVLQHQIVASCLAVHGALELLLFHLHKHLKAAILQQGLLIAQQDAFAAVAPQHLPQLLLPTAHRRWCRSCRRRLPLLAGADLRPGRLRRRSHVPRRRRQHHLRPEGVEGPAVGKAEDLGLEDPNRATRWHSPGLLCASFPTTLSSTYIYIYVCVYMIL